MTTQTSAPPLSPQDARAFATTQLDRLMGFYPRIDGKASFLLALIVTMLGVMAINFPIQKIGSPRGCAGIIAALLLVLSLWRLCYVFFPHLTSGEKLSLIYFGDIAREQWREYHNSLASVSEQELIEDITCQIWRNSKILKIKFDETQAALIFMIMALPFWFTLLFAAALRAGKFVLGN